MSPSIGRILFFPRETFPTDRVRLNALFGKELLRRGHAIDLVMQAKDDGTRPGRIDWVGRSLWIGPSGSGSSVVGRIKRLAYGVAHDIRYLLLLARPDNYDCVLVSDKYLLGAIACLVARARRLRFIFWLTFPYHEADIVLSKERAPPFSMFLALRGRITALVLRHIILPRSDHLLVQSDRMANEFCAQGVPADRMTPIQTGVDLEGVAPRASPRHRSALKPLTVVYLGTLVRNRRLEVLVEMIPILNRRGVPIQLVFIGDSAQPSDRELLERRAAELNVSGQVQITGFLPRPDALQRVREADIGISPFFPSTVLDVASPTKLVEYLALGVPVVANSHPEQSVILRESRAGVCTPWGARYFARAIMWLSRRTDQEIQQIASRGMQWTAANRSYASIADRFEAACLKVRLPS